MYPTPSSSPWLSVPSPSVSSPLGGSPSSASLASSVLPAPAVFVVSSVTSPSPSPRTFSSSSSSESFPGDSAPVAGRLTVAESGRGSGAARCIGNLRSPAAHGSSSSLSRTVPGLCNNAAIISPISLELREGAAHPTKGACCGDCISPSRSSLFSNRRRVPSTGGARRTARYCCPSTGAQFMNTQIATVESHSIVYQ